MEQILNDIEKVKDELSEDERQEIEVVERKIKNLIGKELEVKELRKILSDIEYKIYQIEEKVSEELQDKIFKIRRKIAKLIISIGYIHGI